MCQSGLPDSCGLQQVEANVGVDPDPLRQHLGEFGRHRGEVRQAGGRVCLPDPEEGAIHVTKFKTAPTTLFLLCGIICRCPSDACLAVDI